MISGKRFYRPDEVAGLLALSRRTIYRKIRDGSLKAIKWGDKGPWRIPREELRNFLNDGITSPDREL